MLSVLTVLLVLAWAAIAFLTFGYAALVAKVRALESGGAAQAGSPSRRWPELAPAGTGGRTLALVVSSSCPTCEEVVPAWPAVSGPLSDAGHRPVLIDIDDSGRWHGAGAGEVVRGSELSAPLLLAYQPALLVLDGDGTLLSAEPIGSVDTLAAAAEAHTGAAQSTNPSLTTGVAS
ncbi:hypothetical protein ACWEV4_09580 [Streptomyces sp. NPDC003860]